MTAAVINLFTRREPAPLTRARLPELVPAEPWWTCPTWCAGDCAGGGVFVSGGAASYDCRLHERVVYTAETSDLVNSRPVTVQVRLERADANRDLNPEPTDVVLQIGTDVMARLHREQRIALAEALLAANDLDDTGAAA